MKEANENTPPWHRAAINSWMNTQYEQHNAKRKRVYKSVDQQTSDRIKHMARQEEAEIKAATQEVWEED